MTITIDEGCISCGLCVSACPQVFAFGEDELARVVGIPTTPEQQAAVERAEVGCPVGIIHGED